MKTEMLMMKIEAPVTLFQAFSYLLHKVQAGLYPEAGDAVGFGADYPHGLAVKTRIGLGGSVEITVSNYDEENDPTQDFGA